MGSAMTSAYVTTVGSDRIIKLPPEMPAGTTVAVIAVPAGTLEQGDATRQARFAATLTAIRAASSHESLKATVSDEELTDLVERARKARA